jgi:hypothetical protein
MFMEYPINSNPGGFLEESQPSPQLPRIAKKKSCHRDGHVASWLNFWVQKFKICNHKPILGFSYFLKNKQH